MVNWFNAVDETYRNQLRELNDLNWERFRSELRAEGIAIRSDIEKRLSAMDKRFDGFDAKFAAVDARFASLEARFPTFEERINAKFDAKFAKFEARLFKVMFGFWTATIVPLAALILALNGVFQP